MPPSNILRLPRSLHTSLGTPFRAYLTPQSRPLSTHPIRSLAAKQDPERHPHPQRDAQGDRDKINPEANEYAKSGTDNTAASNDEAAFDPNITDPQEAKKKAGEGNEVNPLDASPANPEISKGTEEEEGGSGKK